MNALRQVQERGMAVEEENRRLRQQLKHADRLNEIIAENARLYGEQITELRQTIWAAAFSQPNHELRISDIGMAAFRKQDCELEFFEDQANRQFVIRARRRTT